MTDNNATIKLHSISPTEKLSVYIDNKKLGNIGNGKEETFTVASGKHTVFVRNWDNFKSEYVELELAQGT